MTSNPIHAARWRVLALYSAWNALMQFEWLRFAPITDSVIAQYGSKYGVTAGDLGTLSLVFPLLFLPLALPSGWLIDRVSLRISLNLVAAVMTVGAALRVVGAGFTALLVGQIVFAIAQPLVMALISRLVQAWFPREQQLQATGLGTLSIFVGLALAFLLIPPTAGLAIGRSLQIDLVIFGVLAIATFLGVPRDPEQAPPTIANAHDSIKPSNWFSETVLLLRRRQFIGVLLLIFIANGYSNSIFTFLEPMLLPQGINAAQSGIAGLAILAGGIVGMSLLPRWRGIENRIGRLLMALSLAGVPLTMWLLMSTQFIGVLAAAGLIGLLLLSPLPLFVDLISRLAGPRLAGTAVSLFWLSGNAGAAVAIAGMSIMADAGRWSLAAPVLSTLLAVNFFVALVFLRRQANNAQVG